MSKISGQNLFLFTFDFNDKYNVSKLGYHNCVLHSALPPHTCSSATDKRNIKLPVTRVCLAKSKINQPIAAELQYDLSGL